ncbi:MAG: radical SAM protein [Pseudomonadota bacterium]
MRTENEVVLSETESLCPECLARIPALRVAREQDVYLRKTCPEHGQFNVIVWRGTPRYTDWVRPKIPAYPSAPITAKDKGCPFDCGLCPDHRQQTCTGLLDVTQRCDRGCEYCFADARSEGTPDPDFTAIRSWYETLLGMGHSSNIQLSGGEPTLRDDLPEIVEMGRSMGFQFIQLNTNGLRLARDPAFVERLKEAGLGSVFLQFDGINDEVYSRVRRGRLFRTKVDALNNCRRNELGVILVPTVVPGINSHMLGDIIRFAAEHAPVVRGVHFQPVSYFGRYPKHPVDADRITLPEVIRSMEEQTSGSIRAENFNPPGCENSRCSFHGNFVVMPDGTLKAVTRFRPLEPCCSPTRADEGAAKARCFVLDHWALPKTGESPAEPAQFSLGDWDILLERARTHMLCISGMCFQDAWTVDLERLKDCCIHVVAPDNRLVPFCAYNLTSSEGRSLHRSGR